MHEPPAADGGTPIETRLGAKVRSALGAARAGDAPPPVAARFIPRPDTPDGIDAWFYLPSALVASMMQVLGFRTTVTEHAQLYRGQPRGMFTVVGERM